MTSPTRVMCAYTEQLEVRTYHATESEVYVKLLDVSDGQIQAIEAKLTGPHCERSHTLPVTFKTDQRSALLITDPCYWTPQLPFLYEVEFQLQLAEGKLATGKHTLGLCRWEVAGRNLVRERRRVVLRAVSVEEPYDENLLPAVAAEMALVVRDPCASFLQRASELGVPLVIDLRGHLDELTSRLVYYSWQPAVALVMLDAGVRDSSVTPTACVVSPPANLESAALADVVAIELDDAQLPDAWAATCNRPVIAIRRLSSYAELRDARQACDQLQADLAPQFDLAGYLV